MSQRKTTETWDTPRTRAELASKFPPPAWAMFYEVPDATGARQRRWADAVAMGLWPSKGLDLHGFEIKISRSDWLHELKKPEKAEAIQQYCDYWWLVAGNPDVVKLEELPSTWGLIERSGKKLRIVRQPEKLNARAVSRDFLAALLRRAHEQDEKTKREEVMAEVSKELDSQVGQAVARYQREAEYAKEQLDMVRARVEEFEAATGVPLGQPMLSRFRRGSDSLEQIGKAINALISLEKDPLADVHTQLHFLIRRIEPILEQARQHHETLSTILTPPESVTKVSPSSNQLNGGDS